MGTAAEATVAAVESTAAAVVAVAAAKVPVEERATAEVVVRTVMVAVAATA